MSTHLRLDGTCPPDMTPDDIEALFQSSTQGLAASQRDDDEPISDIEKSLRTAKLKDILLTAQNAWHSGSESIDRIAEKLGDGSRDGG